MVLSVLFVLFLHLHSQFLGPVRSRASDFVPKLYHWLYCTVLQVSYAARRGFYMVCPQSGAKGRTGEINPALPRGFIQLEAKNRHNVDCTSHELNALNSRLKDATNDCMVLTEQVACR